MKEPSIKTLKKCIEDNNDDVTDVFLYSQGEADDSTTDLKQTFLWKAYNCANSIKNIITKLNLPHIDGISMSELIYDQFNTDINSIIWTSVISNLKSFLLQKKDNSDLYTNLNDEVFRKCKKIFVSLSVNIFS